MRKEHVLDMKKPGIVWIISAIAAASAVLNGLDVIAAVASINRASWSEVVGQIVQSAVSASVSAWIFRSTVRGALSSRLPISLYLWFLLLIYPIRHALANAGLGLPGPAIGPTEVAGAAMMEIVRYIALLVLIVWVALSRALRIYASKSETVVG